MHSAMTSGRTLLASRSSSVGGSSRPLRARPMPARASASQSREEALAQLQSFKSSVANRIDEHHEELKRGGSVSTSATAGGEAEAAASVALEKIPDIESSTYQSTIDEADGGLVVIKWTGKTCGPCKMILPKVEAMADEFSNVVFAKIYTNASNKDLGKGLGIRAAPTFLLYKGGEVVAEVNGAKEAELRAAIEAHV